MPALAERKWQERFLKKQRELGLDVMPAFLEQPQGLRLQVREPEVASIDEEPELPNLPMLQAYIMTPVGPFWCEDVCAFRAMLTSPFELISLQLFGLEHGFCVCDVFREVIPVAFIEEEQGQACVLYLAAGATVKESCHLWPMADLFVEESFTVKEWGQVIPFAFRQSSFSEVEFPSLSRQLQARQGSVKSQPSSRGIYSPVPSDWVDQMHQLWDAPLAGLPDGIKLHAATVYALQQTSQVRPKAQNATCVIYVDGASNKHGQSWSMVVTMQGTQDHEWTETFEGVYADGVQFDQDASDWIGATRRDNVDAELSAIFVALVYALSLRLDVQVLIRPDLRYSLELVNGMVAPVEKRPLTSLVANIGGLMRAQGLFAVVRVRAHIGHAWNELADAVAVHAGKHGRIGNPNYQWLHRLATHPLAVKWWVPLYFSQRRHALPADRGGWLDIPEVPLPRVAPLERPRSQTPKALRLRIKVLSYNVLSLVDEQVVDQGGRRDGDKSGRIDAQFHDRGIAVAGLQEARMSEGCSNTEHYRIFSSSAEVSQGTRLFGCELWFHRTCSWVQGAHIGLDQSKLVVLVSKPRLLLLRLDNPLGVTHHHGVLLRRTKVSLTGGMT